MPPPLTSPPAEVGASPSRPPAPAPLERGAFDRLEFDSTRPLPPIGERDRALFEARLSAEAAEPPLDLPPDPLRNPATLPTMGALSFQAAPPAVEAPTPVRRRRRAMLAGFTLTYAFALVGAVVWGVSWPALLGCLIGGYVGMIAHEVVLHRMLSHRAFRTGPVVRFLLTAFAMCWPARSPIWWAATHRHHHKFSDAEDDTHSPRHGKLRALVGWSFEPRMIAFPYRDVADLTADPGLRFLDRVVMLPFALSLALGTLAGWAVGEMWPSSGMGAMQGLIWWGLWRALYPVLLMGAVNVWAHQPGVGRRRYETVDDTRNVPLLGWLAAGAGWHNNHHHYPHAARAGFAPGEVDPSWWVIRQLEHMGLAADVRDVPATARDAAPGRTAGGRPR